MHNRSVLSSRRCGFTLVELLVVIGIIALLLSILLPTLSGVQRAARTVKCASNLRNIGQGLQIYASQNNDYFPGSGNTNGQVFMTQGQFSTPSGPFGQNNAPNGLITMNDWMTPVARINGTIFNEGTDDASRRERFLQLSTGGIFLCPENEGVLMTRFVSSTNTDWGAIPWMSYNMAFVFTLTANQGPRPNGVTQASHSNRTGGNITSGGTVAYDPPLGYSPRISRIRNAATKISLADGSRSTQGTAPTYDNSTSGGGGNMFADQGPWGAFTRAWFRGQAPGNGATGQDARLYAYRHGDRTPFARADRMRMNAVFWDGHVETLGDLESSNPALWVPTGTRITAGRVSQQFADTYDRFLEGRTGVTQMP